MSTVDQCNIDKLSLYPSNASDGIFMAHVQKFIIPLIFFISACFWTYGNATCFVAKYCENAIVHAFNNLSVQ